MAELARQSSRERFMLDFLTREVGLSPSVAQKYMPGLVEEGYDSEDTFLGLTPKELLEDFEWKKGHIKKLEMYRDERPPASSSSSSSPRQQGGGGGGGTQDTGAPVGTQLPDGSTLMLSDSIIGRGASGIVRNATLTRRSGAVEPVAAKMLAAGASEREMQRFAKELAVSLAAAQQCSGTCRIHGCVSVDGALCLVMKKYAGDLAQMLDARRDAADDSRRVALTLREAQPYLLMIAQSLVRNIPFSSFSFPAVATPLLLKYDNSP